MTAVAPKRRADIINAITVLDAALAGEGGVSAHTLKRALEALAREQPTLVLQEMKRCSWELPPRP